MPLDLGHLCESSTCMYKARSSRHLIRSALFPWCMRLFSAREGGQVWFSWQEIYILENSSRSLFIFIIFVLVKGFFIADLNKSKLFLGIDSSKSIIVLLLLSWHSRSSVNIWYFLLPRSSMVQIVWITSPDMMMLVSNVNSSVVWSANGLPCAFITFTTLQTSV